MIKIIWLSLHFGVWYLAQGHICSVLEMSLHLSCKLGPGKSPKIDLIIVNPKAHPGFKLFFFFFFTWIIESIIL